MKKNNKPATSDGKIAETIRALMENVKDVSKKAKLIGMFIALLVASGMARVAAEEVVGTILFEPRMSGASGRGLYIEYDLDTQDDLIEDMYMRIFALDKTRSTKIYETLYKYLKQGHQVVFENNGLKPFDIFENDRLLAIIFPDGRRIELTQMFSRDVITREFPYLDRKLKNQGR